MQNKLLKEYFTPQELKQMGVDPFAMGDVSSFQRKQTIAPPTAKPKNLSSLVLDYAEQSPTALRVSGGDPLKNLINFAADYVPGLSFEKAKREQDALGQKLALLDLIPGGGLLAKKAITGAKKGILDEVATTGTNKTKEKTLYHATDETFDEFDINKSADGSIWFSDNKEMVEAGYDGVGKRKNVMERLIDESKLKLASWDDADKYSTPQLIQMGFDGVKYSEPGAKDITYQIFNPQKLKKIK